MRKLVLVRHSIPAIVTGTPASEWQLSDEGRRRCEPLAEKLRVYHPGAIMTSQEPKASETGRLVAGKLDIPFEPVDGLHEHDRTNEPYRSQDHFMAQISSFYANPNKLMFGLETAANVYLRFEAAMQRIIARDPEKNLVVVTHGTVMSLYIGRKTETDPFAFWKRLRLPAIAVLSLPDHTLLQVIEEVY